MTDNISVSLVRKLAKLSASSSSGPLSGSVVGDDDDLINGDFINGPSPTAKTQTKTTKGGVVVGPVHFFLDFAQCNSPEAVEYVGEILQTNQTIEWLEVEFRYQHITVDCMSNLFQFVSHHPNLKVLEVRMGSLLTSRTPATIIGSVDEVMRLFLLAAAQNNNLQTVLLSGRPCNYVTEIFKFIGSTCKNIQELELVDFPETIVQESWPPNCPIRTLRLKPAQIERYFNPFSPDGHPGLTGILDTLSDSSSRGLQIQHLYIEQWSWSLSKYLQSCNSAIRSLHLSKVDFRHDRFTGFSPIYVFVFGLQGSKTTTDLCLDTCVFDKKGVTKFMAELKNDKLGIKNLKIKDSPTFFQVESPTKGGSNNNNKGNHKDGAAIGGGQCNCHVLEQLFEECESLERLEFDGHPEDIIDTNIKCVNDGLSGCALSSLQELKLPLTSLSSLGPSLKIAATTHSLSRLELTNTHLKEEDVDVLLNLLADERCQLKHLALQYLSGVVGPKIILALEGDESKIETLRLEDLVGESLSLIIDALVGSLAKIKNLTSLTLVCPDLSPKMEEELGEALPDNSSLEQLSFERLLPSSSSSSLGGSGRGGGEGSSSSSSAAVVTAGGIHKAEPVISRNFARKLEKVLDRNRSKKRSNLTTSSPNSVMNAPEVYNATSMVELPIN